MRFSTPLIEKGLARPSTSPYSSPVVLVKKSGKEPRLTGDYSKINEILVTGISDIPKLSEIHEKLSRANFIACFDLPRAFHQIPVLEQDIPKTAIAIPGRKIEYLRAPFGFANIPGHIQYP
ncbi:hypothetical protein GEMRC1_001114 [Eukaryota sp. GEM-RC1]